MKNTKRTARKATLKPEPNRGLTNAEVLKTFLSDKYAIWSGAFLLFFVVAFCLPISDIGVRRLLSASDTFLFIILIFSVVPLLDRKLHGDLGLSFKPVYFSLAGVLINSLLLFAAGGFKSVGPDRISRVKDIFQETTYSFTFWQLLILIAVLGFVFSRGSKR